MKKRNILDSVGIALLFIASRLPDLGFDIFNTDVWKWKARTYDFSSGVFYGDFALTIQKYHPGVILMWIGTFAIKVYNGYYELVLGIVPPDNDVASIFHLHFVQKLLVVVVIGATVGFIYYALKKVINKNFALIAIVLMFLEPFYIALTRVFHLEGLMSTFMVASFVWFLYYMKVKKKTVFAISAFFAAFSFLTKTSSLFLLPFIGLVLFLEHYFQKKDILYALKFSLKTYLIWVGVALFFVVVFWPALWVIPLETLHTLYRGVFTIGVETGHEQLYFGKLVSDPGISFYFVTLFLRSSPILIVGLVTYLVKVRKKIPAELSRFGLYALLFSIFYALELMLSSKKLDRYLLPSILSLSLVASISIYWFISNYKQIALRILLPLFILWLGFLAILHPDYFSYYNPLGGGLGVGINVIEPKWIIGQHELTKYLSAYALENNLVLFEEDESFANSENLENKLTVAFPEKYYTQVWPFIRQIGGWAVIEDLTPEAKQTNIFVYPSWDDYSSEEQRYKLEFIDSVKLRGTDVYNIYRRTK